MGVHKISCVVFLIVIVNFHLVTGKPFFDSAYCSMFCGDDDDDDTSMDFLDLFMPCYFCPSTTETTQAPISLVIPSSSNAQNLTIMSTDGGKWIVQMVPIPGNSTTPAPTTTTTVATTTASTTAGTTKAGAAGGSTTPAPTTAAG